MTRRRPAHHSDVLLSDLLAGWYRDHARDLPWRAADRTAWGVLVSEVMLQQTPVSRVEPVWRAWSARWPGPTDLAAADLADVLRAWGGLGYPRRALRLHQAAQVLVERHDGRVPDDETALRALPGVGAYTAAAVRAFAFGRRAVVLDTNVRRVLARACNGHALPPPHLTVAESAAADALLPDDDATAVRTTAALMELGALVCTARAPRCAQCPLSGTCTWLADGRPPDIHAERRRSQPWHGTDRQVRGQVLAALRAAPGPVAVAQLIRGTGAEAADTAQLDRCIVALAVDGLLVLDPESATVRLPSSP